MRAELDGSQEISLKAGTKQGLARAAELYADQTRRVKELKAAGRKVMGYICLYPPLEMMDALDLVPCRIFGSASEPITEADTVLSPVVCPFIRSYIDLALKGRYSFLDGLIGAHSCDVAALMAPHLWQEYVRPPDPSCIYFLDVPHTDRPTGQEYFRTQIEDLKVNFLEPFAGKTLSRERLEESIKGYNRQRALVRELYELRKPDPPLISGVETLEVIIALTGLPLDEGTDLVEEVIAEVKARADGPEKKSARLLVWGSILDDTGMISAMESSGANVVMDDICTGTRAYFSDVESTGDPLSSLAHHYLVDLKCPRTSRQGSGGKDLVSDPASRFSYLGNYIRDWKVDRVVLQALKYCDSHAYEIPQLKDYFKALGIPSLYLEHSYFLGYEAQLKNRLQAFLEMVEDQR